MRVVLLVTDLERGGTPLRLARLAQHLHALGVEPVVGCLATPGHVSESLQHAGVRTFACDARHARDYAALARLYQHLREIRPEIVHATLTHANVAARLVGRCIGLPVVTSTATIEIERPWHVRLERLTGRLDRGHIVNSQALAEHVERAFRVPRRRIHVVPASIGPLGPHLDAREARERLGVPPDAFCVAWLGRFDPVKRLDLLIDAAATLAGEGFVFVLAGDGPQKPAIEAEVARRRLDKSVHLLGWQPYVGPVLSAADALACPSDTEGMPNGVLQAFASGTAVVAADSPPLRELAGAATEPQRAALFPVGDGNGLVQALRSLRDDPQRREQLAQAGKAYVHGKLDPRAVAEAVLKVYVHVLREPL